jgi:hypothetical protein
MPETLRQRASRQPQGLIAAAVASLTAWVAFPPTSLIPKKNATLLDINLLKSGWQSRILD